jgi:hypothetical protein
MVFDGIDANSEGNPECQASSHDTPAIWVQPRAAKRTAQDVTGTFDQKFEDNFKEDAADEFQHTTRYLSDDVSEHLRLMTC